MTVFPSLLTDDGEPTRESPCWLRLQKGAGQAPKIIKKTIHFRTNLR